MAFLWSGLLLFVVGTDVTRVVQCHITLIYVYFLPGFALRRILFIISDISLVIAACFHRTSHQFLHNLIIIDILARLLIVINFDKFLRMLIISTCLHASFNRDIGRLCGDFFREFISVVRRSFFVLLGDVFFLVLLDRGFL